MEQPLGPAAVDDGQRGAPRPSAVGIDRALPEGDDLAPLRLPFITADRDRHPAPRRVDEITPQPLVGAIEAREPRSEEHTSELQSLMRITYAVFCLNKKKPAEK